MFSFGKKKAEEPKKDLTHEEMENRVWFSFLAFVVIMVLALILHLTAPDPAPALPQVTPEILTPTQPEIQ
jgi:Trk-type K+ transport system membrane component